MTGTATAPNEGLGIFQGPRLLARNHRLPAERLPDALPASPLEDDTASRRDRGVVRAEDHRSLLVGDDRRITLTVGLPELVCRRICRWQTRRATYDFPVASWT